MDVSTQLTYVVRQDTRPGFYNYKPPADAPERAPQTERINVVVQDARSVMGSLGLDQEGIEIVSLNTKADDLYDEVQVENIYLREVEALVREHTGASRVLAFDYNLRNRARAETDRRVQKPVTFVHNDYTHGSGPQRVRDLVSGEEAEALISRRFAVINVWKPIVGPVQQSPLAVCDAASMSAADFIETDLLYPDRNGEIYSVAHNKSHRWFYVSAMQADEAMLLKCYDADESGVARFTAHSAIEIPGVEEDAPPRESIEVRTLVFW